MRVRPFLTLISKRAPTIVMISYCAALLTDWFNAQAWLPESLAIINACLAIALIGSRNRRRVFSEAEASEDLERSGWIASELAGRGSASGTYVLCFFGVVTVVLTGIQSPSAMLAWTGMALGIGWGIANAHLPIAREPET